MTNDDIEELMKKIEELRDNLSIILAKKKFDLQDEEVIKASQELDIVISEYNKLLDKLK